MFAPPSVQFPFSPNIHWQLKKGIIIPALSRDVFSRILEEAKNVNVLCPGYLLESIIASITNDIFINSDIKVKKWIMPNHYSKLSRFFGLNYKGSSGDIFSEYRRLREAVNSYPCPIFMDGDNNIYFNLLFNYGKRVSYRNHKTKDNNESFWKQIINNTCLSDNYNFKYFDIDLSGHCKTFLSKYNIKDFILLDNSNIFGIAANGMVINNTFIFPNKAKEIANMLSNYNIQCIIMTDNKENYNGYNLLAIDPWNNLDILDLASLINYSKITISSDPNIYLSAPLLNCKKVICSGEMIPGWTFGDLDGLCTLSDNYYNIKDPTVDDIREILLRE